MESSLSFQSNNDTSQQPQVGKQNFLSPNVEEFWPEKEGDAEGVLRDDFWPEEAEAAAEIAALDQKQSQGLSSPSLASQSQL